MNCCCVQMPPLSTTHRRRRFFFGCYIYSRDRSRRAISVFCHVAKKCYKYSKKGSPTPAQRRPLDALDTQLDWWSHAKEVGRLMENSPGSSNSAFGILGIWRSGTSGRRAEGARPPEINRNTLTFIKEVVCVLLAATEAVLCAPATPSGVHHALRSSGWAGSLPVVCRNLATLRMCLLCFISAVLPAPG